MEMTGVRIGNTDAHGEHLHWPTLDVDLSLDSLKHPEAYPLTAR